MREELIPPIFIWLLIDVIVPPLANGGGGKQHDVAVPDQTFNEGARC